MRISITAVIFTVGIALAPIKSVADTIADTMVYAYENSGIIDQNRALLRAADEDVAQAVASMRPILNWAASASYTYREFDTVVGGRTVTLDQEIESLGLEMTGRLVLYDFGRTALAIGAAKEMVLATRQTLVSVEQDVLLRAVQAHMNVVSTSQTLALRRSNTRLIETLLQAASDRFEVGEITRTDVDYARARLAAARAQAVNAEADVARAREEYRAVTGRMPSNLTSASPVNITKNLEEARNFAQRYHPLAVKQRHTVAAAELNIRRAETAKMPTVTMQGSLSLDQDINTTASIGLGIGGPIYHGGALSSQVRQSMARRDAARAGLHQIASSLSQQVGMAYSYLNSMQQVLDASNQQLRAARSAYRGLREEAKLGSRTTLDVLSAEQDQLSAQVSLISARIDKVIASYNVLAAMGVLTAEQLGLPVQLYDPTSYYRLVENAPISSSAQGKALDRVLDAINK